MSEVAECPGSGCLSIEETIGVSNEIIAKIPKTQERHDSAMQEVVAVVNYLSINCPGLIDGACPKLEKTRRDCDLIRNFYITSEGK